MTGVTPKHTFVFFVMLQFILTSQISQAQYDNKNQPIITASATTLKQRQIFSNALNALKKGNIKQFRRYQSRLTTYALYPYLEQAYLLKYTRWSNRKKFERFLEKYDDHPVSIPIKYRYLKLLANNKQGEDFLKHYQGSRNTSLQCHAMNFKLQQSYDLTSLMPQIKALWLHGKSRPDTCDPVFNYLEKHHLLTEDLIWQRMLLAAKSNQRMLFKYLNKKLSVKNQIAGKHLIQSIRKPEHLINIDPYMIDHTMYQDILLTVIHKTVWNDRERALQILDKLNIEKYMSKEQIKNLDNTIALALATADHHQTNIWLSKRPIHEQSESLIRWQLAHALREQNWQRVNDWVSQTSAPDGDEASWQYWLGRSAAKIGKNSQSQQVLSELSQQRNYYGFLASAHLGTSPTLQSHRIQTTDEELLAMVKQPGVQRAYELFKLKRIVDARREWNHLKNHLDKKQLVHLSVLAHQWQWHTQAIIGLAENNQFNAVNMRFPLAYKKLLQKETKKNNLDISWGLAVTRKESAFMPDARSHVGALGLMQLMPHTAREVAKKERFSLRTNQQLLKPEVNIRLGVRLLKNLLEHHDGNQVLATASYNAGKHRVKRWLPKQQALPTDIWIETIPYYETRDYLKNVLAYQQIYNMMLNSDKDVFSHIIQSTIDAPKQSVNNRQASKNKNSKF